MTTTVIVSRHTALIEYLHAIGIAPVGAQVIAHATPADVAGKKVFGVLPLRLAALATSVVEVPLELPSELRGVELTLKQVQQYAGIPTEYTVGVVK
ncbi:MAG: hypothetical protein DDT39_00011 [Firmicutes bacterium]|nr:hypothetical protein [candidate division NPL-UPA2 bacterium]